MQRLLVEEPLQQRQILHHALTPDRLELTLFPTEQCNFRCTYCYEDFAIGRMSPKTVTGVKALLTARSADLKNLHLSWFGGEPLVAYDIMRDILEHSKNLSISHDFSLTSAITTNGYSLNRKRICELYDFGMTSYQISLDGDEEEHDRTRLRIDGLGTFGVVWQNVLLINELASAGLLGATNVILRVHVRPENIQSVKSLLCSINETLNPRYFSIFIKEVGHYGGKNDAITPVLNPRSDDWRAIKQELYAQVSAFAKEMATDQVYVCYAAKANAFTIRADGSIGKCTVALSSRRNRIGVIHEDGSLHFNQQNANLWTHALKSMDVADLGCPVTRLPQA